MDDSGFAVFYELRYGTRILDSENKQKSRFGDEIRIRVYRLIRGAFEILVSP